MAGWQQVGKATLNASGWLASIATRIHDVQSLNILIALAGGRTRRQIGIV
jgi:hypothetical protein